MRFAFLPLFLLVFALLALLKFLSLLFLLAAHLIRLLLLAALEFVLTLLVCILAVQFLLLLLISPLRFLALGVLLPLHLVEVSLMLLLQPGIGGRIVGMARGRRPVGFAAVIFSAPITRVRGAVSVVVSATVSDSTAIITAAMEIAGARSGGDFRATVVDGSQEAAISASSFEMAVLFCGHGDMALVFGAALVAIDLGADAAGTAVEADARDVTLIYDDALFVDVVNHGHVHIGDGAVVEVEASAPVAAQEANTGIAKAIVNAAVEADPWSPVAGVPKIGTLGKSPVARSPEQAGFRGEYPCAGNPEITVGAVGPIARRPYVIRARAERLRVNGECRGPDADRSAHGNLSRGWGRNS